MSALKNLKIADLEPSTRGELALVFEVHEVL
jgi:DNA-directed RNA polymerase subunit F